MADVWSIAVKPSSQKYSEGYFNEVFRNDFAFATQLNVWKTGFSHEHTLVGYSVWM